MSLTIAVRFITGYCVAARSKTDPRPEWPPHPEKLFLALAAAFFEWDRNEPERDALEWLESLEPPAISFTHLATPIVGVATFVPANDEKSVARGGTIQTMPSLKRHRAERLFPRTHLPPSHDTVRFSWDVEQKASATHHRALTGLASRVGRFGHSTSLVQVYLPRDEAVEREVTIVPTTKWEHQLRVVAGTRGTLDRLEREHNSSPYRPSRSRAYGYGQVQADTRAAITSTVFSEQLIVFRLQPREGPYQKLDFRAAPQLCELMRRSILHHSGNTSPSISGHQPDGTRHTGDAHIAYMALPFVDERIRYADGHIMGIAIALPRAMTLNDQKHLNMAIDKIAEGLWGDEGVGEGLHNDRIGRWSLIPIDYSMTNALTVAPSVWCGSQTGATTWATVTPISLDRHSAARSIINYRNECTASVIKSVKTILLDPSIGCSVELIDVSPFHGATTANDFPRLLRKDGTHRRQVHALITFDRPVLGPLLVGAGRYRGHGICRPFTGEPTK